MKEFFIPKEKAARIIYVALLSVASALIILLLIGTIIGLVRPQNAEPVFTFRKINRVIQNLKISAFIQVWNASGFRSLIHRF